MEEVINEWNLTLEKNYYFFLNTKWTPTLRKEASL